MTEWIEILFGNFGELTYVGHKNHVLDGGKDPSRGRGYFCGLSGTLKSIGSHCCSVCSKRDHSITACSERDHSVLNN